MYAFMESLNQITDKCNFIMVLGYYAILKITYTIHTYGENNILSGKCE
jgi:hypothetical protein